MVIRYIGNVGFTAANDDYCAGILTRIYERSKEFDINLTIDAIHEVVEHVIIGIDTLGFGFEEAIFLALEDLERRQI